MGTGDWGLGTGDWGLGSRGGRGEISLPITYAPCPMPNPPFPMPLFGNQSEME
ncbi:hypothetical protein [Tolypothrix sp. PCC 7601]|uniref:hypothetical protein n=1 Tax=Tolypothrix sp. PCC 7601 TaxID=1188 RepID=UPI001AEF3BEB|nr:hypothetical protein [Tolypothrix sp. PCC 7601]